MYIILSCIRIPGSAVTPPSAPLRTAQWKYVMNMSNAYKKFEYLSFGWIGRIRKYNPVFNDLKNAILYHFIDC